MNGAGFPVRSVVQYKMFGQLKGMLPLVQSIVEHQRIDCQNQSFEASPFCPLNKGCCSTTGPQKVELEPGSGVIIITRRQGVHDILQKGSRIRRKREISTHVETGGGRIQFSSAAGKSLIRAGHKRYQDVVTFIEDGCCHVYDRNFSEHPWLQQLSCHESVSKLIFLSYDQFHLTFCKCLHFKRRSNYRVLQFPGIPKHHPGV